MIEVLAAFVFLAAPARADPDGLAAAYERARGEFKPPPSVEAPRPTVDPELREGLRLLFKNVKCHESNYCFNERTEAMMAANALEFKRRFDGLTGEIQPPAVAWKPAGYGVKEFEFESLVRRRGGHPADMVRGLVYFPQSYDKPCDLRFPAALLIHALRDKDDLSDEKRLAKLAASSDRAVVMLIYLPHFGPRRGAGAFITKDPAEFELNVLQSLADIHQAYLVLRSLPRVREDHVTQMGLSLGGMLTLISAGIDPVFDRYTTNVGGGDLANIITYRKSGDVTSQTGRVLKDIDWSVDQARFFLSRFDAITWSLKAKGKEFLMVNGRNDELIDKTLSLDPLIEGYAEAGAKVRLVMHDGTHVFRVKEVGYWNALTKVILPTLNFIGENNWEAQECGRGL